MVTGYDPSTNYAATSTKPANAPPASAPPFVVTAPSPSAPAQQTAAIPGLPPPPRGLTWSQFEADYHLSSSDMATYTDSAGNLNGYAGWLINYHNLSKGDRQKLQDEMVNAGFLASGDATGARSASSDAAALKLVGYAAENKTDPLTYLGTSDQGKLGDLSEQLASESAAATKTLDSTNAVSATVTNPTTLTADIESAFNQALGYAPDKAQIDAFVKQIQGQDVSYAEGQNQANRAEAQAVRTNATNEQTALKKLGPDGVGEFAQAYAQAVHGTGVAGAGTTRGPVTGQTAVERPSGPTDAQMRANQEAALSGQLGVRNVEVPAHTTENTSAGSRIEHDLNPLNWSVGPFSLGGATNALGITHEQNPGHIAPGTPTGETTVPAHEAQQFFRAPAPSVASLPQGAAGTTAAYGGIYALSPAMWSQAQDQLPAAKKYATAGQAPAAIQQAAFTALASHLFDQYGNYHDVAVKIAGGDPGADKGEKELGTNVESFANQVAGTVNDNIAALQDKANAEPEVTTRTTEPDAAAEAAQAAKESDPVGYTAANYASWAGLLTKMLYGSPLTEMQSTADTFTGPVEPSRAPAEGATDTGQAA